METDTGLPEMGVLERLLVSVDAGAFGVAHRVAIGFATVPAWRRLLGSDALDWTLMPFLLTILLLLRLLPAFVRAVWPFSEPALGIWAARRQMSKKFDSYQWQKLFWIGAGLALHEAASGQFSRSRIVVCSVCLAAGLLGMWRWRAARP